MTIRFTPEQKKITAAPGRTIVVVGLGVWGKGHTVGAALKSLPIKPTTGIVIAYDTVPGAFVNDWGSLCYPAEEAEASRAAGVAPHREVLRVQSRD